MSQSSKDVRWGLGLVLFLMLYDGALRKWLLPGSEQIVFILKDLVLVALLVYVVALKALQLNFRMHSMVVAFLFLYGMWVVLQMANPRVPNILVAIWGLKAHLLYIVMILVLPKAFRNLDDVFRVLTKIYPMMVVPVCTLAFFQIASPADGFINLSIQGDTEAISYFGEAELVRVTGTFSYISGMAAFVQVSALLGFGLFLGGVRSRGFLLGFATVLATLPATGSRGVLVSVIASIFIMIFVATYSRLITLGTMLRVVVVTAILLTISVVVQSEVWIALVQRSFGDAAGDEYRIFTAFTNAFDYFDVAGFFGFGAGSANLGAPALAGDVVAFSWLPVGGVFEEESGRIVLELGVIGWIFSLALRVALLFWAMGLVTTAVAHSGRMAVVIALPTMAYGVWVGNGVFAVPLAASYFWFCVALLAMAQFEKTLAVSRRASSARQPLFSAALR